MNREEMHQRSYESLGWDEMHVKRDEERRKEDLHLRVNMCGSDPAFAEGMAECEERES